jgi:hypothetical protein
VRAAQELFGARLLGMFAFGSRIAGGARGDSDLDLGVWLEPPLRRQTSWVPWVERLGRHEQVLDPTPDQPTRGRLPDSVRRGEEPVAGCQRAAANSALVASRTRSATTGCSAQTVAKPPGALR